MFLGRSWVSRVTLMTVSVVETSPNTVGEEGERVQSGVELPGSLASFTGERLMLEVKMLELFMEEVKLESRTSEPWKPLSSLQEEEGEAWSLE